MKCDNDDIEIYFKDSVKLIETAENKTYLADRRLNDAEIIDLGVAFSPGEDSGDDFQPQSISPGKMSPTRKKEREPPVEIIDCETYITKNNTKIVAKPVNTKSAGINLLNTHKENSNAEIKIVDVTKNKFPKENACKDNKKRHSHENQMKQAIQQSNEMKAIDLKKNQGLVGMKVKRSFVDTKQSTNTKNPHSKINSKVNINKCVRRTKVKKRSSYLKVAKEILNEIKKQESRVQNDKEDNISNKKFDNRYSLGDLLDIKQNLLKDLENLKSTLDLNKNIASILKPLKAVKDVRENKTTETNRSMSNTKYKVVHKEMLDQTNNLKSKATPKIALKNNQIKDMSDIKQINDSPKPQNMLTLEEYKKEKGKNEITKEDTVRRKEKFKEIDKPKICPNNSVKVISEPPEIKTNKIQKSPLKIKKPDNLNITNTHYRNKSRSSFPTPNQFTEVVKDRVKKLQERTNKKHDKNVHKNSVRHRPVPSDTAVSLDRNCITNSLNKNKQKPTEKSVESEAVEVPNISINVTTDSDNKIKIEIINNSPQVPKPLVSDALVPNPQAADPFTTKKRISNTMAPKSQQASELHATERVASNYLAPKPLAFDPLVSRLLTSDPLVPNQPVLNQPVPNQPVPNTSLSKTKKSDLRSSKPLTMSELRLQEPFMNKRTVTKPSLSDPVVLQTPQITPVPLEDNRLLSKTITPERSSVPKTADALTKTSLSLPNLQMPKTRKALLNTLAPKPLAPKPLALKPLAPKPLAPKPLAPKAKSRALYPLTQKPVPKSNLTFNSDETPQMIEKAVYEYKMKELYAQKNQMQLKAQHSTYVSVPIDYTIETVRIANISQHPHTADLHNKNHNNPVKILSVQHLGNVCPPNQQNYMYDQSIAFHNLSKYPQNSPVMQNQFPIQRLVTERKSTAHMTNNMASNYQPSASQAANMYGQQKVNVPAANDPRSRFENYGQNMPCMAQGFSDLRTDFTTQQNVYMYQQPHNYPPYEYQYYLPEMHDLHSTAYNVPSQTAFTSCMGGLMYPPPPRPPPPPHRNPTQPSFPYKVPPKEDESIIGKNNNGVIKKINISAPHNYEPEKLKIKEETVKIEKIEENKQPSNSISPVSTKLEMQRELDSSLITDMTRDFVSGTTTKANLKRPYESSVIVSNEQGQHGKYIPCPFSKKGKSSDPFKTLKQNGDQIIKNKDYSPPILPIPPTYESCFSLCKPQEEKSPSTNANCNEGLINLLQLNDEELRRELEKSGYKRKGTI